MSIAGVVNNVYQMQDTVHSRRSTVDGRNTRGSINKKSNEGFKHLESNDKKSDYMDNDLFEQAKNSNEKN